MAYINKNLTFESDKIYYTEGDVKWEVMMSWEDTLMSASAAYVCQGGGDILEVGFGMGISAGYMHSHSISSHTIVENHPDIIPKATLHPSTMNLRYCFLMLLFYSTHAVEDHLQ